MPSKHGLLARQAVLKDEDPQEFDLHRRRMLERLAPDGPEEEAMAERVVALWWRLKRAERMQDEALDYLIEADRGDGWVKRRRSDGDPSAGVEFTFGRAVARDFAERRTLDRLMMYEQRIESALYRTRNELHRLQAARKQGTSRDLEPVNDYAKQSQSPAEDGGHSPPYATLVPRVAPPDSFDGADSIGPESSMAHGQASLPVPPSECAKQSQSQDVSSGAGSAPVDGPVCETKPMDPPEAACSVPARASEETPGGVTTSVRGSASKDGPACETNPIGGGERDETSAVGEWATCRAKQTQLPG
jgi:hypothetical protein